MWDNEIAGKPLTEMEWVRIMSEIQRITEDHWLKEGILTIYLN